MRPIFVFIACWFALALGATLAAAHPVTVRVVRPGTEPQTGQPWTANVVLAKYGRPVAGSAPVAVIRRAGERREFRTAPSRRAGIYTVRVVFPSPGRWNFAVPYGRSVKRGSVTVAGRSRPPTR